MSEFEEPTELRRYRTAQALVRKKELGHTARSAGHRDAFPARDCGANHQSRVAEPRRESFAPRSASQSWTRARPAVELVTAPPLEQVWVAVTVAEPPLVSVASIVSENDMPTAALRSSATVTCPVFSSMAKLPSTPSPLLVPLQRTGSNCSVPTQRRHASQNRRAPVATKHWPVNPAQTAMEGLLPAA